MTLELTRARALTLAAALLATGAALGPSPACASKKGGLMLALNTDMKAPKDVNAIGITVSTNGVIRTSFISRVTPEGDVKLPATLAVIQPDDPNATVRIRALALQESKVRVPPRHPHHDPQERARRTAPHRARLRRRRVGEGIHPGGEPARQGGA